MIPEVSSTIGAKTDPADPKSIASKVQAMFMEVMIKAMEDSVGAEDGLFGSSSTSEIYRGMFREQLGATMGEKIGGSLKDELEKGMKNSASKLLMPEGDSQLPDLGEELADIAIFTASLAEMNGIDLDAEVSRKLAKNEGRAYRRDGRGIMMRVDGADA